MDSATVSDGPDGLKGVEGKDIIRGYNVIPAESEKATEVIKFLDFIASDYKTLKLGFENEIWRWEEGRSLRILRFTTSICTVEFISRL